MPDQKKSVRRWRVIIESDESGDPVRVVHDGLDPLEAALLCGKAMMCLCIGLGVQRARRAPASEEVH